MKCLRQIKFQTLIKDRTYWIVSLFESSRACNPILNDVSFEIFTIRIDWEYEEIHFASCTRYKKKACHFLWRIEHDHDEKDSRWFRYWEEMKIMRNNISDEYRW